MVIDAVKYVEIREKKKLSGKQEDREANCAQGRVLTQAQASPIFLINFLYSLSNTLIGFILIGNISLSF